MHIIVHRLECSPQMRKPISEFQKLVHLLCCLKMYERLAWIPLWCFLPHINFEHLSEVCSNFLDVCCFETVVKITELNHEADTIASDLFISFEVKGLYDDLLDTVIRFASFDELFIVLVNKVEHAGVVFKLEENIAGRYAQSVFNDTYLRYCTLAWVKSLLDLCLWPLLWEEVSDSHGFFFNWVELLYWLCLFWSLLNYFRAKEPPEWPYKNS